ncbi:hypothetical protein BC628DRAFT_1374789 [Trametes gibbosa]|nr:hypothetical protein BC628DRAFT_1374789 [Trametes gibbosa]
MSIRHTPRQAERDIRLHDPHHSHSLPPPSHPHSHPPHLNGNGLATPGAHPGPSSRLPPPGAQLPGPSGSRNANSEEDKTPIEKLAAANEATWLMIGRVAEQMGNLEHALSAYENALRHNSHSLSGLTQVAGIARIKENYPKAVEYFQAALQLQGDNGEVWSALGHCYLMQDDLQKAYAAYQQALYFLPQPKEDPKLWYGIGILYDRYGSLDHAEEAFASVLKMDKDFDKANEILFRLGIIYKQQGKYPESLECFDRILRNPPSPLAHADIWFQIGHVFEQQRDHVRARDAYERVVQENPNHGKVLQQLGWLYHQDGSSFQNQELAIQYLTKSLEAEPGDAQSWYLLGRAYMAGQKYNKAYEAYQQAVYRDGRNPTFWCSIGVLYFQINQYRDALDAYSRAIRINPYISEVWFDLGSLYESCNNQISDAIDAYARASELDPTNTAISQRLALLKQAQATGQALPAAPGPQDVHPTAYANSMGPAAPGLSGPPPLIQSNSRPLFPADARGGHTDLPLPVPPQLAGRNSPGPFRGGPPPPVVLDDSRHLPSHTPLAPMEVDVPPMHAREHSNSYPPPPSRDPGPRGPAGQSLLHHPVPQMQGLPDARRHSAHPQHSHDPAFHPMRVPSTSASPPPHARPRSTAGHMVNNFSERPTLGPPQGSGGPRRSPPPSYPREDPGWNRRMVNDANEWDRDRRGRPPMEYGHAQPHFYQSRPHSPPVPPQRRNSSRSARDRSPPDVSPRTGPPGYIQHWDARPGGPSSGRASPPRPNMHDLAHESAGRRYDPAREYEREVVLEPRADPRYAGSPEAMRMHMAQQAHLSVAARTSESPHLGPQGVPSADGKGRRRQNRDKDTESNSSVTGPEPAKKERKRRQPQQKRVKEEGQRGDGTYDSNGSAQSAFKLDYRGQKTNASPEPASSNGSGSANRSVQPSPTNSTHLPPTRALDEDYDEGVAETLIGLAFHRPSDPRGFAAPTGPGGSSRAVAASPQQQHPMARRPSVSSRMSPPTNKRPLSPGPDDHIEAKRTRVGSMSQRVSPPSNGRPTPTPSTRLSPIPFRQQPTSHSPDMRQPPEHARSYPSSPQIGTGQVQTPGLPTTLPPHPRPIGAGHGAVPSMGLPPMSTRSPPSNGASPVGDERMHSRSASPARGGKREIVLHSAQGGSPLTTKTTPSPSSASSHGNGNGNGNGAGTRPGPVSRRTSNAHTARFGF